MDVIRPRRLRKDPITREMVRETRLAKSALIYPLFITEGNGIEENIAAMDGQKRYSPDRVEYAVESVIKAGINSILLFGVPEHSHKDESGSEAFNENGALQQAVRKIKTSFPQCNVITDVCLCEYTSHGHCGLLDGREVDNDRTLPILAKVAVSHAQAGADMVAPSDMMDGRVQAIREALDQHHFTNIPIMSYSAKYASSFYGPFREAAGCAPSFGDRKTYQMDYHNQREALRESELDVQEGADILMVKPALAYLDVIARMKDTFDLPLAAYSVSGEYSMIKAAAKAGLIDEAAMVCETTVAIFRAGADMLITYFAPEIAAYITEGRIG
ncbi:porphobilinogen synthase [Dehalobacter sp. DCM]|uniref:porphobilinogen synthase n=1 Tax=Dehalobacter sp. DCM TaxID=2907827 RepID=UPI003081BD39|nr:porphobilinogen synthase [Dehalobacter sp. DCM]